MRKGVILEINDLYLTLLTPEGEFLKARKHQQDYQVGEEIHFFPETETTKRKRVNLSFFKSLKARTITLAAILMLTMAALLPGYQNSQVYAYMSIDVNPSIELAVNDELKVLSMKGYNPEGKAIVEDINGWKRKDAVIVAELVLEKIEDKGFFEDKSNVVIATVHKGKAKEAIDRQLDQKISDLKKSTQEENLNLKVLEATSEEREKAQKQGLTTGVYKEKQNEKQGEKQNAKQKPAGKPAEPVKKAILEPENKIKPNSGNSKLEKKEPPGQLKKTKPETPKKNLNQPPSNRGQENKQKDKKKPGVKGKGQENNHNNGNGRNSINQNGKQYKNENRAKNQQGKHEERRGKAGNSKENHRKN